MPRETRYGFPLADWELAKEQAAQALLACARRRGTTTYSGLCDDVTAIRLRPYSFAMVAFLDEICDEQDAAHGTVLASLVTRKDTGMPGEGYFRHASRVGCDVSDRRALWEKDVAEVYTTWAEGEDR
jgi:hypothetical protein